MDDTKVVFADTKEELEKSYTIIEFYDLGDGDAAALVPAKEVEFQTSDNNVYDSDTEFELMVEEEDFSAHRDRQATISDVRSLHGISESGGTGSGVTVVVMDSGINAHPVIPSDNIVERFNATTSGGGDTVGHGTAVAGQISQIAPDADLIDLKIFGGQGSTSLKVILRAYEWLMNNANSYEVVNMSWGSSTKVDHLDAIHEKLLSSGVVDVVAAGNSGGAGGSPATAEAAFSVGACNESGDMSSFSSYNPGLNNPDISAVGQYNVLARASGTSMGSVINDDWVIASGTSFASPEVAGMVAKYLSIKPNKTPREVIDEFKEYAEPVESSQKAGAGLAKYSATVEGNAPVTEPRKVDGAVWAFAGRDTMYIDDDVLDSGKYLVDPEKLKEAFEKK